MEKILGKFDLDRCLRFSVFFAVGLFLLFCTRQHFPWRDEYQTFLVATRTESFSEFWNAIRYERTPPLHYFLLRALWPLFRAWSDPLAFIRIISLSFSFVTFGLIAFRFRFSPWSILLLGLNVFFFREWGVMSRSYALGAALLFGSLHFRQQGKMALSRVMLAFAGCTHLLFFLSSGVILLAEYIAVFRVEKMRILKRPDFWFVAAVTTIVLIQQIPPTDSIFVTQPEWPGFRRAFGDAFRTLAVSFYPLERSGTQWAWNQASIRFGWGILFLIFSAWLFRRQRGLFGLYLLSSFPLYFVFVTAFPAQLRHTGVLFSLFLYFWIRRKEKESAKWPVETVLFGGPALAGIFWLVSWNPFSPNHFFSDSVRLAPYLNRSVRVLTTTDYLLFPAMAESGRNIFDLEKGKWVAYPEFRSGFKGVDWAAACRMKSTGFRFEKGDLWVVQAWDGSLRQFITEACPGFRPIYRTRGPTVTDEAFTVYEFDPVYP